VSSSVPALILDRVSYVRSRQTILSGVTWQVEAGERWVVLGPNGAGKSTLLRIASTYAVPTRGRVEVLGARVGATDLRELRREIGVVSPWLDARLAQGTTARDAVVTGVDATLRRFRQEYTPEERRRADDLLHLVGCDELAATTIDRLSDGERRRVLIARALMPRPRLLILDEPAANLDIGGRELLINALARLEDLSAPPAVLLVTHHLEEVPRGWEHALLLRGGEVVAAGPADRTLTDEQLSVCFGLPLSVERSDGRFIARAVPQRSTDRNP
jgi:iron complex transport system ATP-binding protein